MSRILVIRADHLGDALLTTPLFRALAEAGHEVDFVVPRAFLPCFSGNPHLREAIGLETVAPGWRRRWLPFARWIRARRYDVLILPFALPWELLWVSFFSGVPVRIALWGVREKMGKLGGIVGRLTGHRCPPSRFSSHPRYFADLVLDCARVLDIPTKGISPEVFLEKEPQPFPPFANERPTVGIHPGCAGNTCNFAPDDYEKLALLILDQTDWNIVLTGTAPEAKLVAEWTPRLLESDRVRNTIGMLSLPQLGNVLQALDLFVSTGTGPYHLAAAVHAPTLTPFCPRLIISRTVWGNPNANGHAIETDAPDCRVRPLTVHCDFKGKISPEQMFERAWAILGSRASTDPKRGRSLERGSGKDI